MTDIDNESKREAVLRSQGEQTLEMARNLALNKGVCQGLAANLATAIEVDGELPGGLTTEDVYSYPLGDLGDSETNVALLRDYTTGKPTPEAEHLMERFIGRVEQDRDKQGN